MLEKLMRLTSFLMFMYYIQIDAAPSNASSLFIDAPLKQIVANICQIPEAQSLITKVQKEGPLHIKIHSDPLLKKFGAYWNPSIRTICIDDKCTEGEKIRGIIFELHNAEATTKLQHLEHLVAKRILNKETFVKAVELVEYENSIKASKISYKGIERNLFPQDAFLYVYKNFNSYYSAQKMAGHSSIIERNFYQIQQHTQKL